MLIAGDGKTPQRKRVCCLRGLIVLSADKRRQPTPPVDGRAPEIGDTNPVSSLRGDREEYVLGLEVAMDKATAVDVLETGNDLAHDPLQLLVFNLGSLLQEREEVSAGGELHEHVTVRH